MWYSKIDQSSVEKRTIDKLLALKESLRISGIPPKIDGAMLLATWNIRELDSSKYGMRDYEPLYYIAEIITHFDIVAVQEVREDLVALEKIMDLLGSEWKYITSDVTEGTPGNRERMAFLYDSRKIKFTGIAGEIVIPPVTRRSGDGKKVVYDPADQLYRTPYLCGFRCDWLNFFLTTVHIRYGDDDPDDPERVREIQELAKLLNKRVRERSDLKKYQFILLGDFNIYSPEDATMKALTDNGFVVPEELNTLPHTNTGSKKRHYDQIAFWPKKRKIEFTGKAGVYNFFDVVYKDDEQETYIPEMNSYKSRYETTSKGKPRSKSGKKRYYRTDWRTHQMSDHLPMWIQIKTSFEEEYLKHRRKQS